MCLARSSSNRSFSVWCKHRLNFHLNQTKPSIQRSEAFNEHYWTQWVAVVTGGCFLRKRLRLSKVQQCFDFVKGYFWMLLLGWKVRAYLAVMQNAIVTHVSSEALTYLWCDAWVCAPKLLESQCLEADLLCLLWSNMVLLPIVFQGRIYRTGWAVTLNTVWINDCCLYLCVVK